MEKTLDKNENQVLILLKHAQNKYGYVSGEEISRIADRLGVCVGDVYGVATFYSFLSTRPQGKNVIRLCKSIPCDLKDYQLIVEILKKELGINPGETTGDGKFTLELTNCIGACDEAPAIMINDRVYGSLTPAKVKEILADY